VLVSWDREATSTDNFIAGAQFFNYMHDPGTTVDSAIGAVHAAGFGTSLVEGTVANLGYTGTDHYPWECCGRAGKHTTAGNTDARIAGSDQSAHERGSDSDGLCFANPDTPTATPVVQPSATSQPTNAGPAPTAFVLRTPIPLPQHR
jgi:hypothetical protein